MTTTVCIVDYGVGNRRSVEKALQKVGIEAIVSSDPQIIANADGLVLPGVGAFPSAVERIRALGLDTALRDAADAGTPILGACLGMQLLFDRSAEHGGATGLGLIPGEVVRLDGLGAKLPHIGWSPVTWNRESVLTSGLADGASFYHVHSYVVSPTDANVVAGSSEYGTRFASVVEQANIFGVQFHPEKSSTNGLRMLANFGSICAGRRQ
ncbi:MAG: imidazole glycerol phosphate synthase subunit HisH [Solirubrobacteraceae bacterium]|nr:imidazole glycerol phosphate synthase subunit HisH [Solirubrobacteraceae bacterium]